MSKVTEDDGYPQNICIRCTRKLSSAHTFITTVISTQKALCLLPPDLSNMDPKLQSLLDPPNQESELSKSQRLSEKSIPEPDVLEVQENVIQKVLEPSVETNLGLQAEEEKNNYPDFKNTLIVQCAHCEMTFDTKVECQLHALSDHKICQICNLNKDPAENVDSPNSEYQQCQCVKKRQKKKLNTNILGTPNLCSYCGKSFKLRTSLHQHIRFHTNDRLLDCKYCNRPFIYKKSLQAHVRCCHLGMKPYKCITCGARFTTSGSLHKHEKLHNEGVLFSCKYCGKKFTQSSSMRAHKRIHTLERPYKCVECEKTFAWKTSLRVHVRCHNKPIKRKMAAKQKTVKEDVQVELSCTICGDIFPDEKLLVEHMELHPKMINIKCNNCDVWCSDTTVLISHYKIAHNIDTVSGPHAIDISSTIN